MKERAEEESKPRRPAHQEWEYNSRGSRAAGSAGDPHGTHDKGSLGCMMHGLWASRIHFLLVVWLRCRIMGVKKPWQKQAFTLQHLLLQKGGGNRKLAVWGYFLGLSRDKSGPWPFRSGLDLGSPGGDLGPVGLGMTVALWVWVWHWLCGYELDLGPVDLVGTLALVVLCPIYIH